MRGRSLFDRVMHFLVHNSIFSTVAVIFLIHCSLLFTMLYLGVMPLVQFNILSVVVYSFCVLLCRSGHVLPVYISVLLEVTIYTVISTFYVGLWTGTYFFLFSIVPIIIYLGCFLFKGSKRWMIVLFLALDFAVFVFLFIRFSEADPVYTIPYLPRTVLFISSSFAMILAVIFYNFVYIYSSEVEVSSLEQKNKQLTADAEEDALTSLLNRRGFLPLMEGFMANEMSRFFCVAFLDIDNFKRVNDSFGHDAGDEVLRHIAGMIVKEMHGCPICRWGGEEIIILMKDYDMAVAKEKMEYLRKSIESAPTVFFNKRIPATVTIGLEENSDIYKEPEEIIKVADERMYYGKQHGKNIVIFEDEKP